MFEVTYPGQTNYLRKFRAGIIQVLVQSACQACTRHSAVHAGHVGIKCDMAVVGKRSPKSSLSMTASYLDQKVCPGIKPGWWQR